MTVQYGNQRAELELVVVGREGPSQLGRDWLKKIKLDWQQINQIHSKKTWPKLLKRHCDTLKDELGLVEAAPPLWILRPNQSCASHIQCPTL